MFFVVMFSWGKIKTRIHFDFYNRFIELIFYNIGQSQR